MASQWAAKRKLAYGSITIFLAACAVGIPLFLFFYETPTCFDGVKNQNEKGVDCGGVCTQLCSSDISAPIVLWQRVFEVVPGVYNAVAYIQNPNVLSRVDDVEYIFRVYDSQNELITSRTGRTFLPANQAFAVFEAGIRTGARVPARTAFEFSESPEWLQNSADLNEPSVTVENISLIDESTSPRVDATVRNLSLDNIKTIGAVAILYDAEDNAIAASRTLVENLRSKSSVPVTFTWPTKFASPVVRKEIILRIYPAGIPF